MRVPSCPNVREAKENEISILFFLFFWGGGHGDNENHSSKLKNRLPPNLWDQLTCFLNSKLK